MLVGKKETFITELKFLYYRYNLKKFTYKFYVNSKTEIASLSLRYRIKKNCNNRISEE